MLVARGYNFACIKKRSNCITVPTLLSMIVASFVLHLDLVGQNTICIQNGATLSKIRAEQGCLSRILSRINDFYEHCQQTE